MLSSCFPRKKSASHADSSHVEREKSGGMTDMLAKSITAAGIKPVLLGTRDATRRNVVLEQRRSMTSASAHHVSQKSRVALSAMPKRTRMSRLGTMNRGVLVKNLEDASKVESPSRGMGTAAGLRERLRTLGLASVEMEGDGNCQFRAVADQLFGTQEAHELVRSTCIGHMRGAARDFFSIYFESEAEYAAYLKDMARSRTWGDELTLRACVEAFGCKAHVITSEAANWYLVYTPEATVDQQALVALCQKKGVAPPRQGKEIFINYISPIHYNAVAAFAASSTDASRF